MPRPFVTLLLFLFAIASSCTRHTAECDINLNSVDLFFAVTDSVAQRQEVAKATWDSLAHSDGYVMAGWQKRKGLIRDALLIAFHPDSTETRNTLLQSQVAMSDPRFHTSLLVRNYVDMKQHWSELQDFRHNYDYASIQKQARQTLQQFLPDFVDSLLTFPNIGFICGDAECRSKRSGITLDINYFYKYPEEGIRVLTHEMFHTYRAHFEDHEKFDSIPVLWVVNDLQNEGIADLIDKPLEYDPVAEYAKMGYPEQLAQMYLEAVAATSDKMARLDSLTLCWAHEQITKEDYFQQTSTLFPLGGHPNGRYITNLLVAHGLQDQLLSHFADPDSFIMLYNQVAARENLHVMSEGFILLMNSHSSQILNIK
ncbi:MAG: hypothetical protein J6X31_09435 [Bacteroidales bacterium]|nr:hypothetical protein [Bacteroidales bacterium]